MNPGIYENISNEAYHASEGISRSGIMTFRKTPLHYWNDYINPYRLIEEPTHSMIFGSALHELILEPEKFKKNYVITSHIDKRTVAGKKHWTELEEMRGNRYILSINIYEQISRMKDSILNHHEAFNITKNSSYEHSIYWNDPFTGVLCKSRPDIMCDGYIADIKTTDDASPESFKYSIRKYGYHIQAAMLLDGMNQIKNRPSVIPPDATREDRLKSDCNNFIIIAVEKKPPYAVAVYVLDEAAIEIGREIYKSTLVEYKKCLEENNWPSYQTQTISI